MAITERLAVILDAKVDGFVRDIRTAGQVSKTSLDDRPVGRYQTALDKVGVSSTVVTGALKAGAVAATAMAGTKLVSFARDSIDAYTDLASKVRGYQRVTGEGAETSSEMVFALDTMNISADKGSAAMFRLAKGIGSGKVDLSQYGVEVKRTAEGNVDMQETLLRISDAYNATSDPGKRAALVMDAFGRSGKDLIPILARGREGLKQLFDEADRTNHILSQEDLDRAREFTLATHELEKTFEGLNIKAGNALTPVITDLTEMTSAVIQLGDATHVFDAWGVAVSTTLRPLTSTVKMLKEASDLVGLTSDETNRYGIAQKYLNDQQAKYAELVTTGNGKSKEARDLRREIGRLSAELGKTEDELASATVNAADRKVAAEERHRQSLERERDALELRNQATIASFSSDLHAIQANQRLGQSVAEGADALTLQQDALSAAGAEAQAAADRFEALNGRQATAEEKADFFRAALIQLQQQFPQLAPLIQGYIDKINAIPPSKHTTVTADTSTAEANLRRILGLQGEISRTNPVIVPGNGSASTRRFATGGAVPGPRGAPVPAIVHGGEYVLDEGTVDAIKAGRQSKGAARGTTTQGGAAVVFNLTINAASLSDRAVAETVWNTIREKVRRSGRGELRELLGV